MNMAYNGVFAPRDTTYVECTGSFVNKKGLRGVYCVRESMDFDEIPEIPGVVRFYMKAMFLLTEARDGTVELLQVMTANPLGKLPAWMFNKTSMAYSHMSDDYAKYLQQKRLLAYVASKRKPRHPIKKAKTCSSCAGAFRGLRARHECWGCRESMCGKCVVPIPRVLIGVDGSMKAVPDEFCKRCFLQARSYRTSSSASSFRLHASDDTTEHSHHSNQTRSSSGNESYAKDLTDEDDVPSAVPPQAAPAPAFDAMDMESHLSQMQLGIETQRYLVAQMRSRLEAQAV
ncbi:hypothetical protein SPRG_05578 [Saprolegnia parasitica CBS 223.65]|uniref:FYVE zinc finger domain-containing protein n=1 Tax=Saprolegnia parasitica (strain CBS 223.65) TaxID=695850 RepID=A0A067CK98_SAPPC|nr:hypothetical protein SPRG_05578 [Saprolegnia parasitica CBS 223.65]KDO29625.1 hypothetical protein SPRG_05578 [Saprolegnia parasitica CBS 223.65]|eukprot:XP_012199685.1 hypothetical protein SPRG_05578 [Saprolegnia parasitica CBS 223.65]